MRAVRTRPFARTTAGIATTLALGGLTFATASPASAAPDTHSIGAAQARADDLSQKADAVAGRHDTAEKTLAKARTRLTGLSRQITTQRRLASRLQTQVASLAVDQYDATGGTSAPATPLTKDSEALLANVTVVTEDTDGRAERLAAASETVTRLSARRVVAQRQVGVLASRERVLQKRADGAESTAAAATAKVVSLQEQAEEARQKAYEQRVGPAVAYAMAQVGKAYVWGAAGPSSFDCSGLTLAAWSQAGVSLPHSSSAQYASGPHVSESELQPGDLVFYYSPISHVGMYIGGGKIVNALNPGSGVKVSGLHDMPYVGAVRPG